MHSAFPVKFTQSACFGMQRLFRDLEMMGLNRFHLCARAEVMSLGQEAITEILRPFQGTQRNRKTKSEDK